MSATRDPVDVLARTLFGEARGEGREGMQAVANVIMNRVKHPTRWHNDVIGVCLAPKQFSAWNKTDPNREKLLAVTAYDPQFRIALELAQLAVMGELEDITKGADHYHTHAVSPSWSQGQTPVAMLGNHRFFRLAG